MTSLLYIFLIALCFSSFCFSCTDFLIKAEDGSCVVGRSMEFAALLPARVQLFTRGQPYQTRAPNDQKGMQWTSKYAFVGIYIPPLNTVVDGFNEKGLSVGALWMPGTQYPDVKSTSSDSVIYFTDLVGWLLGNFATVEEAKAALEKVHVYADRIPEFNGIPPIHLSIADASGKGAVLEFSKGEAKIYDNPVNVLTNAPEFPWHLTNLRNYISLSAVNAGTVKVDGTVLEPLGQGTGLLGIPGDWTPPSRFVRATAFKQALKKPKNAEGAVSAAIHLLNTVDIPYGAVRGNEKGDFDYTQWIVVKDLKNRLLHVRTYPDQNIQTFDFLQKDLDATTPPKGVDLNVKPVS